MLSSTTHSCSFDRLSLSLCYLHRPSRLHWTTSIDSFPQAAGSPLSLFHRRRCASPPLSARIAKLLRLELFETNIMGSSQSQPAPPSAEPCASSKNHTTTQAFTAESASSTKPKPAESGYALATRKCAKKQRLYDACYTAALSSKDEDCAELFEAYRSCFLKWMSRDMARRGVRVSENSMIGEYLEEESR